MTALWSCRKDPINSDTSLMLEFSNDSILFDTVFTTVGSTTKTLKVYNRNNDRISISSIQLEGGSNSPFRINVDGMSGWTHQDVEIAGNDSLFIFVEVTLDPNNQALPFVIEEHILFRTNGNDQEVLLTAWGQDANFHVNLDLTAIIPLDCDEVWFPDKPHVIYGIAYVDEGCTLTIQPGTQVYVHANSGIWVNKGTLDVQGSLGAEVVFQGDRLEAFFDDQPGQWGIVVLGNTFGGILLTESNNSSIDYAIFKNGLIGIQVDSLFTENTPSLRLTNTKISNMSAIGLYANSGAYVEGYNNLVYNCGQTCGAFLNGGNYEMEHCTFANYWTISNRQTASFVMRNYYEDLEGNIQIRPVQGMFRNCIMYGNNADLNDFNEFVSDIRDDEFQDYKFEYCLVDTDVDIADGLRFLEMKSEQDPRFEAPFSGDFHLRSNSPAIDAGLNTGIAPTDLDGFFRPAGFGPDLGCFERQ